jgi:hypothetical protein
MGPRWHWRWGRAKPKGANAAAAKKKTRAVLALLSNQAPTANTSASATRHWLRITDY